MTGGSGQALRAPLTTLGAVAWAVAEWAVAGAARATGAGLFLSLLPLQITGKVRDSWIN